MGADVTAVAVAQERLTPLRRFDLADHLIDLAGAACLLGHPATSRMARLTASDFYTSRTDTVLLRAIARLTAFVSECAARGSLLPSYHPCYVPGPTGAN
jgi:hypothetical protein